MNRVEQLVQRARDRGRHALTEHEGYALLEELGLQAPRHALVRDAAEARALDLAGFAGERVVVKVCSHQILHKSDVGGVAVVARTPEAVAAAVADMASALGAHEIDGYLVVERVPFDPALGNELLLGLRVTPDFGPVVSLGAGGIYTEFLAKNFVPGRDVAVLSPALADGDDLAHALDGKAIAPLLFGGLRGQAPRISREAVTRVLRLAVAFARAHLPAQLGEIEINPMVVHDHTLLALDVLATVGAGVQDPPAARPLHKLKNLLEPHSVAVMGVSNKPNPGHIIVKNLLREGFDPAKLFVIKPDRQTFEGCPCVPDIPSLPAPVDLLVLAISAAQAPEAIEQIVAGRKAESVIVIPGGLGETSDSQPLVERMQQALTTSRATSWQGPLLNGGNSLGVRSRPGHYDTMFIPQYKLPPTDRPESPLALLSQSGALAVARASKLASLNPRYIVSIGNQMDLCVGDYLAHFARDPQVEVVACYVEGFRPGDGLKWLEATREISRSGRTVILYRAGRTAQGAAASASHTASVAGDYTVTRELALQAGAVVADSLQDFEELVRTFTLLRHKRVQGWRLGAVSNAGFECVGFADNLGRLALHPFSPTLNAHLEELLVQYRLKGIVEVHHPLDLTPMLGDAGYEDVTRALLEDPDIDVAVVGCVPLTGALQTLQKGDAHHEDLTRDDAVVARLGRLFAATAKPWVAVVDGGSAYDAMATLLESQGVPTFRTADRALRALEAFCAHRLVRTRG